MNAIDRADRIDSPAMTELKQFIWTAKPGEKYVYHVGLLSHDARSNRNLGLIAREVALHVRRSRDWVASAGLGSQVVTVSNPDGPITATQRRIGPLPENGKVGRFAYEIIKLSPAR